MKVILAALLLVATVFGVGALQSPAFAAEQRAAIGIRLVDGPTDTAGGLATDRISHVLPAGESASWTIEVSNTGPEAREIPLQVGPAALVDGQFQPADEAHSEMVDWVQIDPATPEVPADGTVEVEVTIDVPADATDGDHAGVIWASATSEGQITQVNRIGLRTLITVADGQPAAGFTVDDITVDRDESGQVLLVEVTNTGGRMLEVAGSVDLHDGPGGVAAGELPLAPMTIAAGDTTTLSTPLSEDLPAGQWTADATVIGDHLSEQATATITIGPPHVDSGDSPRAALIALALLLLLLALMALIAARRRKAEDEQDHESERQFAGV